MTAASELLAEAGLVSGHRELDYGSAERNLSRIAELWTAAFGWDVTPRQVALAMVLLKVARDTHRPKHDNLVDIAGYAALAAEVTA